MKLKFICQLAVCVYKPWFCNIVLVILLSELFVWKPSLKFDFKR